MHEHAIKIKYENRSLRHDLLELIQRTRALHKHKHELEEQKKTLLREKEYALNLERLKKTRDKKMYEAFGLAKDAGSEGIVVD